MTGRLNKNAYSTIDLSARRSAQMGIKMNHLRETIKNKKRIVVKIGSSSLTHKETGDIDYIRMEKLVRELSDIRNQGKDVIPVSYTHLTLPTSLIV